MKDDDLVFPCGVLWTEEDIVMGACSIRRRENARIIEECLEKLLGTCIESNND